MLLKHGYLQYLYRVHELYTSRQDFSSSTVGMRLLASCWCRGWSFKVARGETLPAHTKYYFLLQKRLQWKQLWMCFQQEEYFETGIMLTEE